MFVTGEINSNFEKRFSCSICSSPTFGNIRDIWKLAKDFLVQSDQTEIKIHVLIKPVHLYGKVCENLFVRSGGCFFLCRKLAT